MISRKSAGAIVVASAVGVLSGACATPSPAPNPAPAATPTPRTTPRPPVPAARVPDQPYVGTPRPVEQPYLVILGMKDRGATNEELLAKVRGENVVYSLSTYDIQRLRASGVSQEVIAAMLGAGRTTTPAPATTPGSP